MGFKSPSVPTSGQAPARGMRVQQSSYGDPIPIFYGERRMAPHLVWSDFFQAHAVDGGFSGSSKGPTSAMTNFRYNVSAIMVLGEGALADFDNVLRPVEQVNIGLARPGRQVISTKELEGVANDYVDGGDKHLQPVKGIEPGLWRGKRVRACGPSEHPRQFKRTKWHDFGGGRFVTAPGDVLVDAFSNARKNRMTTPGLWADTEISHYAPERYPGLIAMVIEDMGLGNQAALPQWNMPPYRLRYAETDQVPEDGPEEGYDELDPPIRDAAPDRILADLLANPKHGGGWHTLLHLLPGFDADLGDASPFWRVGAEDWGFYVRAHEMLVSPGYETQTPLAQMLEELALLTDTAIVWSEGLLKMIPYGDAAETSTRTNTTFQPVTDPAVYTTGANTGVRAALTLDDFCGTDDGPVVVKRKPVVPDEQESAGYYNHVSIEFDDRANAYNKGTNGWEDEAAVARYGKVSRTAIAASMITTPELAQDTARRVVQRFGGRRATYTFTLGWWWCLLEPMDVVTVPGEAIDFRMAGQTVALRITAISEDEERRLAIEAEPVPALIPASTPFDLGPPTLVDDDRGGVVFGGYFATGWMRRGDDGSENPIFLDLTGALSSEDGRDSNGPDPQPQYLPDAAYFAQPAGARFFRWAVTLTGMSSETFSGGSPFPTPYTELRLVVNGIEDPGLLVRFAPTDVGVTKLIGGSVVVPEGGRVCIEVRLTEAGGSPYSAEYQSPSLAWSIAWETL